MKMKRQPDPTHMPKPRELYVPASVAAKITGLTAGRIYQLCLDGKIRRVPTGLTTNGKGRGPTPAYLVNVGEIQAYQKARYARPRRKARINGTHAATRGATRDTSPKVLSILGGLVNQLKDLNERVNALAPQVSTAADQPHT